MTREFDYDFIKLLIEKKLIDSYQFYKTCKYKLLSAKISLDALIRLANEYISSEQKYIADVFESAVKTGKAAYMTREDDVDFLGEGIPRGLAIDKLAIEIFSILQHLLNLIQ